MNDNPDWLDEIFDLPESELSERQLATKKAMHRAFSTQENSDTAPSTIDSLNSKHEDLIDASKVENNHIDITHAASADKSPLVGKITRFTRTILPYAAAASIAAVAVMLLPTTMKQSQNDIPWASLLEQHNLPEEYETAILGTTHQRGGTGTDDSNTVIQVENYRQSTLELVKYLHENRQPYQVVDDTSGMRLRAYIDAEERVGFNQILERLNATPATSEIVDLYLSDKAD